AEVVELGIEAPILRPHPEIASLQRDAKVACAGDFSPSLRSLEAERHLSQLDIGPGLDVRRDVARREAGVAEGAKDLSGHRRGLVVVARITAFGPEVF